MQSVPTTTKGKDDRGQQRFLWSVCFLGWCALVTVTASIILVFTFSPFLFALQFALAFWGFYAIAAPWVLWLARRYPLNRVSCRPNLWVHLVGVILFVVFCEGGFAGIMHLLEPQALKIMEERQKLLGASSDQPETTRTPSPLTGKFETGLPKPSIRLVVFKSQFGVPLYWVFVGVAHSLAAMAALREREKQAAQLAAHLTQAQLAGLRTQLQPHFLFNTLNSIAALIPRDSKLATEMVMNLSDLLRMTLREPQSGEITLSEELELLRHYVDIQHLRFGDRLVFHVEVTGDAMDALVPPLLLQPLVENAIRHGVEVSGQTERITVDGRVIAQELVLLVANTFSATSDENRPTTKSTGVGLANTQARLKVHYGVHQHLKFGPLEDGGFQVTMRIPIRTIRTPMINTTHED